MLELEQLVSKCSTEVTVEQIWAVSSSVEEVDQCLSKQELRLR